MMSGEYSEQVDIDLEKIEVYASEALEMLLKTKLSDEELMVAAGFISGYVSTSLAMVGARCSHVYFLNGLGAEIAVAYANKQEIG